MHDACGELSDTAAEHRQVGRVRLAPLLLGVAHDSARLDALLHCRGFRCALRIPWPIRESCVRSDPGTCSVVAAGTMHQRLPAGGHQREYPPVQVRNTRISQPLEVPLHDQRLVDQVTRGVGILKKVVGITGVDAGPYDQAVPRVLRSRSRARNQLAGHQVK
jgi:hypothetical protein